MIVQILRRVMQLGAVALVAALAALSLYGHYRSAGVVDDEVLMSGMRGETLARTLHSGMLRLDNPQAVLDGNRGTWWSMRVMGIDITDPLAAAEAVAATHRVHWPLMLSVLVPVVATVVLGKVFCSWICPGYLLFEVAGKLRRVLRVAELHPAEVRFAHANKYIFLFVGLGLAAMVGAPLFAMIYPPAVISRAIHAWIFGTELVGMVLLMGAVVLFELFVAPRWWCRTMCPGGALYGLLGAGRVVRVELARDSCTGCAACVPVCEAGINPITQSTSIECDNCGVCITHCDPAALKYTLRLPVLHSRPRQRRRSLTAPSLLLLGLGGVGLAARPALAHHVLGLPHYSYKENYPQRPTLEYPATSGPYDILLTSYPGDPVPGEPTNLAFYVKNRESGGVYADAVAVRVLKTSTFGDNEEVLRSTAVAPFDNQHKFQCTFPTDAEYVVELSVEIEGQLEVMSFLMVAGHPTATASLIASGACGLVLLLVILRAVDIKRRRRRLATPGLTVLEPVAAANRSATCVDRSRWRRSAGGISCNG